MSSPATPVASSAAMHHSSDREPSSAFFLEAHAATAVPLAAPSPINFDAEAIERRDQLHQRLDVAADHAVARFHALDGGQGQARRAFGQRALVDSGEGPGGPQLARRDHMESVS